MKRYRVVITESAEQDLMSSYYYILFELEEYMAAEHFRTVLYERIKNLEYAPRACELCEGFPEYRVAHALKYRIFYRIDEAAGEVVIIRVFHSKRDVGAEMIG